MSLCNGAIETCSASQRLVNNAKPSMMPKAHPAGLKVIYAAQTVLFYTLNASVS